VLLVTRIVKDDSASRTQSIKMLSSLCFIASELFALNLTCRKCSGLPLVTTRREFGKCSASIVLGLSCNVTRRSEAARSQHRQLLYAKMLRL
jgi:hypothetical protein